LRTDDPGDARAGGVIRGPVTGRPGKGTSPWNTIMSRWI
jgi:hypothetical protein